MCREYPNLVVLRTFSKAYGLAGLRVGYAVAHDRIAKALRQTAVPFGVNSIAQAAAVDSLRDVAELKERVDALVEERARVAAALRGPGMEAARRARRTSSGSPSGLDSTDFSAACHEAGLMVRQYGDDGVRQTIGETEANDRLIEVCRQFGPR